ncbi:MAG: O-antigen ligase family protein [Candidatus Aminicenantales bacterium]
MLKNRIGYIGAVAASAAAVGFFYKTYVPLTLPFQTALVPVLAAAFLLAAANAETGTLFFLLALPLINSLPYFFGLYENVPQAPTALVLFLFYFLGRLAGAALRREGKPPEKNIPSPMFLAAGLVTASALIVFFRYSHFHPFVAGGFYEYVANVNGVTAGGGRMSAVFSALTFLGGFAWFALLAPLVRSRAFTAKAVSALAAGLFAAAAFGLFQHFKDLSFGNTPFWTRMGQINATFKDPNAFGAYICLAVPLLLGAAIAAGNGRRRLFLAAGAVPALLAFPFIGSRSSLLGLIVGLLAFGIPLLFRMKSAPPAAGRTGLAKRRIFRAAAAALLLLVVMIAFGVLGDSRLKNRLSGNWKALVSREGPVGLSPERYFLWKEALSMIRDYPLTGVGIGAYIIELPNYYALDASDYRAGFEEFRRNDSAENLFLQTGAEMGLPGAAAFAWLFALVAIRAIRVVREKRGEKDGPLALGAAAGIAAYFVSIQFHSYIGSFETNFMFWTLGALVFGTPVKERELRDRPAAPRTKAGPARFCLIAAVAAFAALHLWNSTHSLSLPARTRLFGLKQEFGFYPPERDAAGREFRWTGKSAGFSVRLDQPQIRILLSPPGGETARGPVYVSVDFSSDFLRHRIRLGTVALNGGWEEFAFPLPRTEVREGLLLLVVSRTRNPGKMTGSGDFRDLGVAVGEVR